MVLLFCCFLCTWTWFSCIYLDNNCSILFFFYSQLKMYCFFLINWISCSKFSSTFLGQSEPKMKVLGSLITIKFSSIIIMTWLSYSKLFRWFYCIDEVDTKFFWFNFLICMNCFQLLFVLIILQVWLIKWYFWYCSCFF